MDERLPPMATKMHRLQISLPDRQVRYLEERARVDGVSMAEVVRRLIDRESESQHDARTDDRLWDIAGIAEDRGALIEDLAVSENPDRYLAGDASDPGEESSSRRRTRRI